MATANPAYSAPKDLTRCGICNEIINEPKALPCLHTFCLECIREWSKPSRESVTCPIVACKKTTPMPSNGVDGLHGNVFVSSLIDRRSVVYEICNKQIVGFSTRIIPELNTFRKPSYLENKRYNLQYLIQRNLRLV